MLLQALPGYSTLNLLCCSSMQGSQRQSAGLHTMHARLTGLAGLTQRM